RAPSISLSDALPPGSAASAGVLATKRAASVSSGGRMAPPRNALPGPVPGRSGPQPGLPGGGDRIVEPGEEAHIAELPADGQLHQPASVRPAVDAWHAARLLRDPARFPVLPLGQPARQFGAIGSGPLERLVGVEE